MSLLSRLAVQAARAYGILSSNPNNVPASYLAVAGGGSGGAGTNSYGGGGGAGGYQASTFTLSTLNTYSILVGAGGASNTTVNQRNNGSNSVISGTGLTTITSIGGGGGGAGYVASSSLNDGGTGGSGGGGAGSAGPGGTSGGSAGAGTSGQGNNGGAGAVTSSAGGGGGASAVGGTGSGTTGASGGAGSASSISGSSVTYAGGGAGAGSTGGTGGSGGGGAGASYPSNPVGVAGTINLGAGGGGGVASPGAGTGGAGGSGIVIISYTSATPRFVGGTLTTSGGNQIHTFTSSGTLSPLTPVTASYLVVAGGGGSGSSGGGGGGAGGLLASTTTLYSGATYVVTVGGGGTGSVVAVGGDGSNSVLSGTGITTITSTGGGGGGHNSGTNGSEKNGRTGGSGGGGAANNAGTGGTAGTGTSGQGNNGGIGTGGVGAYPNMAGGGGGGAGAVGAAAVTSVAGAGGVGSTSSISGTSTYYAGGGGGSGQTGSAGAGGLGGGGAGSNTSVGISGTANTGGGGGGANTGAGGSGGSGTVIISYAGSQVFNGGLVTSSGGNTIHTFNATGALTPLTNNLNNSLRFRGSASAFLNRTPTVTGNQQKWTWSAWVKLGAISLSSQKFLFSGGPTGTNNRLAICLSTSNQLCLDLYGTATVATTNVCRDPSAWYHMVIAFDTTQATAGDRYKFYVNGNQVTSFASTYTFTQNANYPINGAVLHRIADATSGESSAYFDGYMTDINFIDGQALEPYYFGNNDAYGNWKPILYKGTYGTNGFYLTFADTSALTTSSNAGLGKDTSGNGNYWTTNNISITAGTTYDAMLDVPTNTSATVANYAVMNPLDNGALTISNANLTLAANGATHRYCRGTFQLPTSGKYYWETVVTSDSSTRAGFGIALASIALTGFPWSTAGTYGFYGIGGTGNNTDYEANGTTSVFSIAYTSGDILQIAYDADNGYLYMGKNNSFYNSTGGTTGNPSSGTNPTSTGVTASSGYFPFMGTFSTGTINANFGQRPFTYTPPTGFVALNTYNLPTPTILQGNKYMDATTYTGTGVSQVVVDNAQFQPDFVWVKGRSGATDHALYDSVRGTTKDLVSNSTAAETTQTTGLTSFNSNGFTVGALAKMNTSAATYVGWQWQAGQGSSSSNTSGSITSTVSVNATAGFSIVTYTGTGAAATVGHGLGVAPKMIIVKSRSLGTEHWSVYHTSLGNTQYILLNLTNAASSAANLWNNTTPTSSVFSILTNSTVNTSAATYVAYCWAEIAGFSKFGSYTGNGSTDGTFIYMGFRPKFVMVKRTDSAESWYIYNTSTTTYNAMTQYLVPNTSAVEGTFTFGDYLSNGFKVRNTAAGLNASGGTYIYMAFAENPFKNANAR
jgi:hypothetical protein